MIIRCFRHCRQLDPAQPDSALGNCWSPRCVQHLDRSRSQQYHFASNSTATCRRPESVTPAASHSLRMSTSPSTALTFRSFRAPSADSAFFSAGLWDNTSLVPRSVAGPFNASSGRACFARRDTGLTHRDQLLGAAHTDDDGGLAQLRHWVDGGQPTSTLLMTSFLRIPAAWSSAPEDGHVPISFNVSFRWRFPEDHPRPVLRIGAEQLAQRRRRGERRGPARVLCWQRQAAAAYSDRARGLW